jgi:capsular polysaccharide transport system ATP-binding protein
MIILQEVTRVAGAGGKKRDVLTAVSVSLPPNRSIAVLGPAGEDTRVFIDLLAGIVLPTAGRIVRHARVSFPAGHLGGFTPELSVRLNVAHVARLYGADVETIVDFVAQVSDLGKDFDRPYGGLSSSRKRYLSEILAFSIPFDVYLLRDDVVRSGGKRYNREARALFEARAKTSGMIIASQDPRFAREFCDMGLVLANGQARLFHNIERALAFAERAARPSKKPEDRRAARKKSKKRRERRKASDE